MPTYNSVHRQQLFHWIGRHLDDQVTSSDRDLNDDLRKQYVACLRGALRNGLWVKTPQVPDCLGNGDLIKVTRPIACFTEWTLGQSLPHTTRYGRLGLGFPKRFVLSRGGQPLTYVRDSTRNDPYTAALKALARLFKQGGLDPAMKTRDLERLRQHFEYLSHFNKRIKRQALPRAMAKKVRKTKAPLTVKLHGPRPVDPFLRSFGSTLHYLEEREWRIVYDRSLEEFFTEGPGAPKGPQYYLPVKPGRELFTVVLPDNHTVSMAMQDREIRAAMFPKDAPHVTVLSLQDIGTF